MNQIEEDFIEFVAEKNGEPMDEVSKRYEAAKTYIDFGSKEYLHHEDVNYHTLQVFFSDHSEKSLFASYRHYAYADILRMLSYSFRKTSTPKGYVKTLIQALKSGDFNKITSFIKRKTAPETAVTKRAKSEMLLEGFTAPTILDYGCGLAHLSFEMAKKSPASQIILLDLDTVKLDFVSFRFKKHGINHKIIRIQEDNQYPELPTHTICIATDVLEHLHEPLRAYVHIRDSMENNGILYGNFEDHKHGMYHVHADMTDIREAVSKDYNLLSEGLYRKR